MKKILIMALTAGMTVAGNAQMSNINNRAQEIVSRMTLEEKVGQMAQISIDAICKGEDTPPTSTLELDMEKLREVIVKYHIGSILNSPNTRARSTQWWNKVVEQMQEVSA